MQKGELKRRLDDLLKQGQWQWQEDDRWKNYEKETSDEIENELQKWIKQKKTGTFTIMLTKGSYFSMEHNKKLYNVTISINNETPIPYYKFAKQTNTMTYQPRNIRRLPSLKLKPIKIENIKDNITTWQWKDNNAIWNNYELNTSNEIDIAFKQNKNIVPLTQGSFFSKTANQYSIQFGDLSVGIDGSQINSATNMTRPVRRVANIWEDCMSANQLRYIKNIDQHIINRQFYEPLCVDDYSENINNQCIVCNKSFEINDLFEKQKRNNDVKVKKQSFCNHKYKIDCVNYKKRLQDNDIIYLNKCLKPHYYHMKCATESLNNNKNYSLRGKCIKCNVKYTEGYGEQPPGLMNVRYEHKHCCEGYEKDKVIKINFKFSDKPNAFDDQDFKDAKTGKWLVPDTNNGRKALQLIRAAFIKKVLFISETNKNTGKLVIKVNKDIPYKINYRGGKQLGWSKEEGPKYFSTLQKVLKNKYGITNQQRSKLN